MSTIYIRQSLSNHDLKTIHRWLIQDYDFEHKTGLLYSFTNIVQHKEICWGLFYCDEIITIPRCIGFALLLEKNAALHINLFSIDSAFRKCGYGRNFILTVLDHVAFGGDITLNSLPSVIHFWKKMGFVYDYDHKHGEVRMIQKAVSGTVPFYHKIPIK